MRTLRLAAALLTAGILVGAGLSASPAPVADPSILSMRDECIAALTYPSRSPADMAWLEQCKHALDFPTPAVTPTATPTVQPSVPPAAAPTYRTAGRYLVDPQGARVVVRGPEQVLWQAGWLPNSLVSDIGRTGANTVRILPYYLQGTPTGEPRDTLAQIEDQIRRGIAAHMLVDVAIDGGRDTSVWLRPEVRALMVKYERWIVVHAMGESYESTDAAWATRAKSVVSQLRAAGYRMPLYVMSREGGRNLPTLLARGAEVVAADPLHNVVLGWQAYWGSNGGYQNAYGMSLDTAFARVAAAGFPIQVGLTRHSDVQNPGDTQTIPYASLIQLAQANALSWLWWDYRMGVDNLIDGVGQRTPWSGPVLDAFGVAVRTAFQQAQVAP